MQRKALQQGQATLVVSLPAKWVHKHDIVKGQSLEVVEEDNTIVISTESKEKEIKKEFNIDEHVGEFNKYILNYFYQKGYDEVKINFSNPEQRQKIIGSISLGRFDIISREKKSITIKSLMPTDITKFDTFLRKAFLIIIDMGEKIIEAIKNKEYVYLTEIKENEKINNKYCDLCHRILNKKMKIDSENIIFLYCLVRDLEKVGDSYRELCNNWDKSVSKDILTIFKSVHDYFRSYYELYYEFSKEKTDYLFNRRKILLEECKKRLEKANKSETLVLFYFMEIIEGVFALKAPLFLMKL
ncbi:hypothetical protein COV16_00110 [Candidatus Woesearchaeota archaeon CG10_big_fil_rev_8_21_14_0_10_34_8]|nr:MAG: hypothetical protein COV16_00110 [Candidatus Woesearchaeota archaeon CG10_big_fil_rev_8_21_14_0_10_34_8]